MGLVARRPNLQRRLLVFVAIEPATQFEQRADWFIAGWGAFEDMLHSLDSYATGGSRKL